MLKAIEVLALIIRGQIVIKSLHFSFIPGRRINYNRSTYLRKKKSTLEICLEKVFDPVPPKVPPTVGNKNFRC